MQHCGVCSAISDLVRRIMCLGGSRRGSGESYYQELDDEETRRGAISVDRSDPNVVYVRMAGPVGAPTRSRQFSEADWLLLETLDTRYQRPLHTGRFLTMHKRRRKRLTTRSLAQEPGLLDDIHHGQVQCLLGKASEWPFNAFALDNVTGGRSLPVLCVHLFHWYGLLDHFQLEVVRVWKLFTLIEEGYHSTNPYHNAIHATDVTQAMHCFLQEEKIRQHLTPLEIMSSLVAAVTHDLDHPGVNQPFLIATSNHLAALYENTSVLENHHWRSAMGCLIESNMAEQLGSSCAELSTQISSLILATDITRQQEFLTRFKRYMDQDLLDMKSAEYRHFILQIALKCADISNPCRPWDISRKWSQKVCEEFFRQGDYERQLSLPVTSMCDRQSTSISKIQAGFFRFVVAPLFQEWHRFLDTPLSTSMMGHLQGNKEKWDSMVVQENAEETKTEISDAEMIEEGEVSSEEDAGVDDAARSVELLLPSSPENVRRASLHLDDAEGTLRVGGRRHSVPLSMPRLPIITKTITITRRESLAIGENRGHRRFPSGPISEEEDVQLCASTTSVLSSSSSTGPHHSSATNSQRERPVSAENLLPEPSIASITTSLEASRLSTVLQGGSPGPTPKGLLTRQQTFPPLAPSYMRHRYMSSAGADISEALDSRSSSSCSFSLSRQASEQTPEHRRGGDIDAINRVRDGLFVIRDNTNRTLAMEECVPGKREQCEQNVREKGSKVAKFSECATTGQQRWEKENVDPRHEVEVDAAGNKTARRITPQGLARRRGSAPVGISHRLADDGTALLALRGGGDRLLRRGSVPTDVTRQSVLRGLQSQLLQDSECMASLPRTSQPSITLLDPSSTLPTGIRETGESFRQRLDSTGNNFPEDANIPLSLNQQYPRRLSVPLDFSIDPSRLDVRWPSDNGTKSRSRKKRELRRRKSGGPEMFADVGAEASAWQRWARRQKDPVLARRRGSLPITLSGGNSPVEVVRLAELLAEGFP